jgi:hypothetical protein
MLALVPRIGRNLQRAALVPIAVVLIGGATVLAAAMEEPPGVGRPSVIGEDPDACQRPYAASSPWNTPIESSPTIAAGSAVGIAMIEGELTSDPTQYTYPVYEVTRATPRAKVEIAGRYSRVTDGGRSLELRDGGSERMPIPELARAAAGSDAQIILIDRESGDEWGAWRLDRAERGWRAQNAYRYNVRWSGVPPRAPSGAPFASRGAGLTYLAGLVRPCEIARGRIDHALAFAYDWPSARFIHPATKSDGAADDRRALPEGARLQLDPGLPTELLEARGCDPACITIAEALQRYGMYVVDNAGRPKVMLEYEETAHWEGLVTADTVTPIPLKAFRWVVEGSGEGAG